MQPAQPEDFDLVIVPGVAFDPTGNRLGYGAGYYDRFLPRLRPKTPTVAACFDLQMVDSVFPAAHDIPLDFIVTESSVYTIKE